MRWPVTQEGKRGRVSSLKHFTVSTALLLMQPAAASCGGLCLLSQLGYVPRLVPPCTRPSQSYAAALSAHSHTPQLVLVANNLHALFFTD